jgi:hypothetical protein
MKSDLKRYLISFLIVPFIHSFGFSQKFVNEFLNIGIGARAHGMSGAVLATASDGTAAYWNPAGLSALNAPLQLNAMHAKWFGGIANYEYFSIARKVNDEKKRVVSLSFIRLGIDNIPNTWNLVGPDGTVDFNRVTNFSASDYAGMISMSSALGGSDCLYLGGTIKVIHRSIGAFGKAWGFGADIGLQYRLPSVRFGLMLRDATSTFNTWSFRFTEEEKRLLVAAGNDIPVSNTEITLPRLGLGAAWITSAGNFNYTAEINIIATTDGTKASLLSTNRFNLIPVVGMELSYADKVFVRLGAGNIQRIINPLNADKKALEFQPNAGVGFRLGRLKIDYGLANLGTQGGVLMSHIFSLGLDFIPKQKQ